MRKLIPLLGLVLVGCRVDPGKNPDPVEVTGQVTSATGKPVTDVVLTFQPVDRGATATAVVKNGQYKASVIPGTYTFFFAEGPKGVSPAGYNAIPEKYRAGSLDRKVEVKGAGEVNLSID